MACRTCGQGKRKNDVCEVHRLVDGDTTIRLVKWCELCKAYICDYCRDKPLRRAEAAARRLAQNLTK